MRPKKLKIRALTRKNLLPYGIIIDSACVKDIGKKNSFGILLKERSKGWRIGYLVVCEREIKRLENHPDSLETFEPVKGRAVITFAPNGSPEKIEAFLLDKPVVVKKGVWHEVAAVSKKAELKIFENIGLKTKYHALKKPL